MVLKFIWGDMMSQFENSQAGGQDQANSNVDRTPPLEIPVTYESRANGVEAIPNIPNIILVGGPAHNMNTVTPTTHGDEPASPNGGIASGDKKGESRHITGVSNFILQGAPVTKQTNVNSTNRNNTVGSRVIPSQTKVSNLS